MMEVLDEDLMVCHVHPMGWVHHSKFLVGFSDLERLATLLGVVGLKESEMA